MAGSQYCLFIFFLQNPVNVENKIKIGKWLSGFIALFNHFPVFNYTLLQIID